MSTPRLTTYRFRVLGGDADNPTEYEVPTVGRDVQRAEQYFADKGWGTTQSRPMTSAALVAYFALKRRNEFTGTWEQFEDWYLSIEPVERQTVSPTEPGLSPG